MSEPLTPRADHTTNPQAAARLAPALLMRMADGFAFSSGLAAAVGAALTLAACLALDAARPGLWIVLTTAGTFIIYNLDRLRDLDRDHSTSPIRTQFISRVQRPLYLAVAGVAVAFAAVLASAPPTAIILTLAIGFVGLFHRRLKRRPAQKALYVSVCWVAACVGFPWIASGRPIAGLWVGAILLASLASNLIASNLRDDEFIAAPGGRQTVLSAARGFALLAVAIAIAGPAQFHPLAWIPFCEALALVRFRPTERYGHFAVDGALLIGALAASVHFATGT